MPPPRETFAALRSRRDALHAALTEQHPRIGTEPPPADVQPVQQLSYCDPSVRTAPSAPRAAEEDLASDLAMMLSIAAVAFVIISLTVAMTLTV